MWKPGQSGNPAGRVLGIEDIAPYARQHGRRAIDTMVACLRDPKWKLPAAIALLDRGYGKPTQTILGNPDQPLAIDIVWAPAHTVRVSIPVDTEANEKTIDAQPLDVVWRRPGNGKDNGG